MTIEQMVSIIKSEPKTKEVVDWNNTMINKWEKDLLIKLGAINDEKILCDYPVLQVTVNGETTTKDMDGDVYNLENKKNEVMNTLKNVRAKIIYVPRTYGLFNRTKDFIRESRDKQEYAIKINNPNL